MIRNSRLSNLAVALTTLVVFVAVACSTAAADVKDFKITGGGLVDFVPLPGQDSQYHFAVGEATHVGRYFGEGYFHSIRFLSETTVLFKSSDDAGNDAPFVITAADGSKLALNYGHTLLPEATERGGIVEVFIVGGTPEAPIVFAVFLAEFTPQLDACTGRFKKVIGGSFIMLAISEEFVLGSKEPKVWYDWDGVGTIEFRDGK